VATRLDPGPAAIVAPSSDRVHGFDFALLISLCFAPSRHRRGGQGNGQRITAQGHEGDESSDRPLGVGVGADGFGDIADGAALVSARRPLAATPCVLYVGLPGRAALTQQ
jgi:hypothetical protein